mgnify:CR=1 FL=1
MRVVFFLIIGVFLVSCASIKHNRQDLKIRYSHDIKGYIDSVPKDLILHFNYGFSNDTILIINKSDTIQKILTTDKTLDYAGTITLSNYSEEFIYLRINSSGLTMLKTKRKNYYMHFDYYKHLNKVKVLITNGIIEVF